MVTSSHKREHQDKRDMEIWLFLALTFLLLQNKQYCKVQQKPQCCRSAGQSLILSMMTRQIEKRKKRLIFVTIKNEVIRSDACTLCAQKCDY